jgi:hypothetical protein
LLCPPPGADLAAGDLIIGKGAENVENKIVEVLATQGPFVILFVYLLFYVLKQNAKREGQYQDTINKLADRLAVVEDIKAGMDELRRRP